MISHDSQGSASRFCFDDFSRLARLCFKVLTLSRLARLVWHCKVHKSIQSSYQTEIFDSRAGTELILTKDPFESGMNKNLISSCYEQLIKLSCA
ncbi:unnamed protein product [Camellia sinensis]